MMESRISSTNNHVERDRSKAKRKEILEKKKAIDELIKSACSVKDQLAHFPPFRHFDRNGLSLYLESGSGDKLSASLKRKLQNLLKVNMEKHYGHDWIAEEKVKRREMVTSEARYIFVYEAPPPQPPPPSEAILVGFVHFRFTLEEEIPVLYIYEIQLQSSVQGKGLGKFLMQLLELIALKNCMSAVVLTVQKANAGAMNFYISKLGYTVSSISPSRVDPLMGVEKSYEILCKAFNCEAKVVFQESGKGWNDDVAKDHC